MSALSRTCTLHPQRAASGRCVDCGRSFCKECLTPHAGRMACASCLAKLAVAAGDKPKAGPSLWVAPLAALAGALFLWTLFTAAGLLLARLPADVQELHADKGGS